MMKHTIPLVRRRRKAIGWLITAFLLMLIFGIITIVGAIDIVNEDIDKKQFVYPETTAVPEPIKHHYNLPLSEDVQDYVEELCTRYSVRPTLVYAIIKVESDFDANLVGDDGKSCGLMQIYATEHTQRCITLGAWNLLDPQQNIRVGIDFLAELYRTGHDDMWVLSWYNGHGGEPCEYSRKVLEAEQNIINGEEVI